MEIRNKTLKLLQFLWGPQNGMKFFHVDETQGDLTQFFTTIPYPTIQDCDGCQIIGKIVCRIPRYLQNL